MTDYTQMFHFLATLAPFLAVMKTLLKSQSIYRVFLTSSHSPGSKAGRLSRLRQRGRIQQEVYGTYLYHVCACLRG